jgi:polyhydroxyalkanoic acid synthase PhaR subunit
MTSTDNPTVNRVDIWKQMYEANERAWNGAFERTLATPSFAQAQGRFLESMLVAQRAVRDSSRTMLEAMNLPTREDIARLGELITGFEEKIDQLEDRVLALQERLQESEAASTDDKPRPRRR